MEAHDVNLTGPPAEAPTQAEDPFEGVAPTQEGLGETPAPAEIQPAAPGVAEGSLDGDGATLDEERDAVPPQPEGVADDGSVAPAEAPQEPVEDDGATEPVEPVEDPEEPQEEPAAGGAPSRDYMIFEEAGENAWKRLTFQQEGRKIEKIRARNVPGALRASVRLLRPDGTVKRVAVTESAWNPRRIRIQPVQQESIELT